MTAVWDTTLVLRVYPGGTLEGLLADRAQAGEPVAVTAPTVMEVVRGLELGAPDPRMASALAWFTRLLAGDLLETLALDRHAAAVAGRLRARRPAPPTGARRRGTKPEQRAGWVLDIQIAACAWVHGRDVATHNTGDFDALADLIDEAYPGASRLVVLGPPDGVEGS